jgi:tRNA(Ile)-lysidine synthase
MAQTGPYGPSPRLAVAVSGGADSLALALLAHQWAGRRNGSIIGLIVDHGLRAEAAIEARITEERLAALPVEARIIALDLPPGPAVQARARAARHQALARAAREAGAVHLLLGHHRRDQTETVSMRAARGARGLAGMAAFTARRDIVMLRPLLGLQPEILRAFLRQTGFTWIEDPSNTDPRFERVRVRAQDGRPGPEIMRRAAIARQAQMLAAARQLSRFGEIRPEGFALWRNDTIPPEVLAELLRVVGGRLYAPDRRAVARLADRLRPATLGGVQLARWRDVWLLAREPASCAPSVALGTDHVWDGRFRIAEAPSAGPAALQLGALGSGAAMLRKLAGLPSLILQSLPAVYDCGVIIAVPHLRYGLPCTVVFDPPAPVSPLALVPHPFV